MPEGRRPTEPILQGHHLVRTFGEGKLESRAVEKSSA